MYLRQMCQIVAINEKKKRKEKLYVKRIIQYYYTLKICSVMY